MVRTLLSRVEGDLHRNAGIDPIPVRWELTRIGPYGEWQLNLFRGFGLRGKLRLAASVKFFDLEELKKERMVTTLVGQLLLTKPHDS